MTNVKLSQKIDNIIDRPFRAMLKPEQEVVANLHAHGIPQQVIADQLGITIRAVRERLYRASKLLNMPTSSFTKFMIGKIREVYTDK